MNYLSPAEAFDLFVAAYSHLECAALPGSQRVELGGLPYLNFVGLDGEVTSELLAFGFSPPEIVQRIQNAAPGLKHWLTVFTAAPQDDLAVFLGAGYRHRESEALLVRRLDGGDLPTSDPRVARVSRAEELIEMNAARGFQVFHSTELDDPLIHIHYMAEHGRIAAWGTTLMVQPDVAYIANMYTLPECRRKGFARAILSVLLSDAARAGARHSLLVSSQAGYLLYHSAGFQRLLDCLVLVSP